MKEWNQVKLTTSIFIVHNECTTRLCPHHWHYLDRVTLDWKRTLLISSKIWILCFRGKNNIYCSCHSNIKFHFFSPSCNILYLCLNTCMTKKTGLKVRFETINTCDAIKKVSRQKGWFTGRDLKCILVQEPSTKTSINVSFLVPENSTIINN